jgi:hypothetical protein
VNAGAVGLVFTAVYELWQNGYLDGISGSGNPLGRNPCWLLLQRGALWVRSGFGLVFLWLL